VSLEVPTFAELQEAGKSEIQARNSRLTDFNEGSNLDALTGAGAVQADEVIRIGLDQFASNFVDTAEGSQLDALAVDRFGLIRKQAGYAVGTLRFTRGTFVGVLVIPAGTSVSGSVNGTSVSVTTDAEAQMLADESTVDVDATVTVTGTGGNIDAEVLTSIDDEIDDADATVTNPDRFVGGRTAETDDEFRVRIRRYFQTVQRATVSALVYGATQVGGVQYAAVDESFIDPQDGGYVLVVIGDPDARANDALVADVEAELENWRPAGVHVVVEAAEREEIEVAVTIRVTSGVDTSALADQIRAALLAYSDARNPGATWYRSAAQSAALEVSDDILDAVVDTPTADQSPTERFNAVRVNSDDLSITFVEV
jgi:hypothetical protein